MVEFDDLQEQGVFMNALELRLPEEMTLDAWALVGRRLCRADQVMKWWIGDWAAFGAGNEKAKGWRRYGALKKFADANQINYQTLRDLAWVSRSVELSRRRDNVEWSKHKEVAGLKAPDQEKWLEKAQTEELPVAKLRREIWQSQGEHNALESDGPVIKFVSKACDDLVHWLQSQPEAFWSEERRTLWRQRLRPIAEFWEKL